MSHFSKIIVKIKEKSYLVEALKILGYNALVGNQLCRGYNGNKVSVDVLIKRNNEYDIGFQKDKDSYVMIADWYGIKDINQVELTNNLTQMYSLLVTKSDLKQKGFSLSEEKLSNGSIRLIAKRLN